MGHRHSGGEMGNSQLQGRAGKYKETELPGTRVLAVVNELVVLSCRCLVGKNRGEVR